MVKRRNRQKVFKSIGVEPEVRLKAKRLSVLLDIPIKDVVSRGVDLLENELWLDRTSTVPDSEGLAVE